MDKWLAQVHDILLSNDVSALELLDIIHKDLVSSEIVVFTPKGEQKSILNGATALDFAYMIHSHIGNSAIAAKVNMKLVPLSQVLKSGDQVEIITAANATPKMEWLQFLQTRYARTKVIEYFRGDRDNIAAEGKNIYDERIRQMGLKNTHALLKRFMDFNQIRDAEELYFRVGLGVLGPEQFKSIIDEESLTSGEKKKLTLKGNDSDIKYKMAECCNPIPGDPVVGFLTDNNTVVVHKKSCEVAERLASRFGNRIVMPQWTAAEQHEYPIKISLKGLDRIGLLSEISSFISKTMGINILKLQLTADGGLFEGNIELRVKDKRILEDMVEGLKKINGIQDVVRTDI